MTKLGLVERGARRTRFGQAAWINIAYLSSSVWLMHGNVRQEKP